MDAILDICLKENYFKMPQRKGKQGVYKKNIPTNNIHKYTRTVVPIHENQCITKEGALS